jgi:hypothetical protein
MNPRFFWIINCTMVGLGFTMRGVLDSVLPPQGRAVAGFIGAGLQVVLAGVSTVEAVRARRRVRAAHARLLEAREVFQRSLGMPPQ